ncbi:MAG: hypothetical protein JO001_00440 [Alphaproteobacteria bacterium]|nr:hypothetical protein [Alphaproteobacteria bacterium]
MKLIAGRSRLEINELLLARLREGKRDFDNFPTEKAGIVFALKALADFLDNFEEVQADSLAIPIHTIIAALEDADEGTRSKLLEVTKRIGRAPASTIREAIEGCAVFVSARIAKYGQVGLDEADAMVAGRLTRIGLKPLRGSGTEITGRLVAYWREQIQQDVGKRRNSTKSYDLMTKEVFPPTFDKAEQVRHEALDVLSKFVAKYHGSEKPI